MPTTIELVYTEGPKPNKITRFNGEEDNITIDNNDFDDDNDFLIEKRNLLNLMIQLQNIGSTNSFSYEIYGSIDPSITPPAFDLKTWELANNGSGNISASTNKILDTGFLYVWVLIRMKRLTTSLDTTAKISATGGEVTQ